MIDVEMEGGVYMIGGIALETIYWYTLLICAGLAVLLIILEMSSILMAHLIQCLLYPG